MAYKCFMRIAISAESFLPRVNGVSNSVLRIIRHLEDNGHEAMIFAQGGGPSEVSNTPIFRTPAIAISSVAQVDLSRAPIRILKRELTKFQPDIVHLASPFLLGDQMGKAAKSLGIPTLAVYQTDVAGFANFYGFAPVALLFENWLRKIHSRADLNLAPSTHAKSYLNKLGIENVELWGRGVDTEQFNPSHRSDLMRKSWGADSQSLVIGYVGRLAPEKRVESLRLINQNQINRKIKIVIIGDGPSRPTLEALLPEAHFAGHLSGKELGAALASMDLLITPGENETFCQVIQEAMASAVPVVAPAIGGPRDLVRDGESGLLYSPGDAAGMVESVNKILNEEQLRITLGRSSRAIVEAKTWPKVCDKLLGHYETVLSRTSINSESVA